MSSVILKTCKKNYNLKITKQEHLTRLQSSSVITLQVMYGDNDSRDAAGITIPRLYFFRKADELKISKQ